MRPRASESGVSHRRPRAAPRRRGPGLRRARPAGPASWRSSAGSPAFGVRRRSALRARGRGRASRRRRPASNLCQSDRRAQNSAFSAAADRAGRAGQHRRQHARRVLALPEADGEGVVAQRVREAAPGGQRMFASHRRNRTQLLARAAHSRDLSEQARRHFARQAGAVLLRLEQAAQRLVHRLGSIVQVLHPEAQRAPRPSRASRRRPAPCAAPPCARPPPGARSARRASRRCRGTRARMMRVSRSTSG